VLEGIDLRPNAASSRALACSLVYAKLLGVTVSAPRGHQNVLRSLEELNLLFDSRLVVVQHECATTRTGHCILFDGNAQANVLLWALYFV
jgi:hypothetical protein